MVLVLCYSFPFLKERAIQGLNTGEMLKVCLSKPIRLQQSFFSPDLIFMIRLPLSLLLYLGSLSLIYISESCAVLVLGVWFGAYT
jgi:hypothetical protein